MISLKIIEIAPFFRISQMVNSKDGFDFAMLFTLETTRKAGGLQILCCQEIVIANYNFTLDAPDWRDHTSYIIGFGVRLGSGALRLLQRQVTVR